MSIRTFLMAVAVAAVVPAVAMAGQFGPGGRGPGWGSGSRLYMAADTNGDGVVTAEEHAAFQAARQAQRPMLRADTNGDGMVSAEERTAFQAQRQVSRPCPFAAGQAGAGRR